MTAFQNHSTSLELLGILVYPGLLSGVYLFVSLYMIIKITTDTKLFQMFYFKNALYMYFNNSATARQVHVSEEFAL